MSASVFAIVVAIEQYGGGWKLPGATVDAWLVANELLRLGVAAEAIKVFVSPGAAAKFDFAKHGIEVRVADREAVELAISDELRGRQEEWLLFFWGGHGVVQADKTRHVLYVDARKEHKRTLDLNNLLEALASDLYKAETPALMKQVIVVDACGTYYHTMNPATKLAPSTLPVGEGKISGRQQWFFLSASPGEPAAHETPAVSSGRPAILRATGVYTAALLELLGSCSWPCDFDALGAELRQVFKTRKEQGNSAQTPTVFFTGPLGEGYEIAGFSPSPAGGVQARTEFDRDALAGDLGRLANFQTEAVRDALFESLPLAVNRPRPARLATDARALVDACATQPFGFESLIDRLEQLSVPDVKALAAALDK